MMLRKFHVKLFLMLLMGVFPLVVSAQIIYEFDDIQVLAFNSSGTLMALGRGPVPCNPNDNTPYDILLIDPTTDEVIERLNGQNCPVNSVDWSPNDDYLISSDINGIYILWDMTTYTPVYISTVITYNPGAQVNWNDTDNTQFLYLAFPSAVQIIDAQSGNIIRELSHDNTDQQPISARWRPNNDQIVTGNRAGDVELWDASNGSLIETIAQHSGPVRALDCGTQPETS